MKPEKENAANQWQRGEYTISTERARIDLEFVHGFLSRSYWAKGIPFETVRRSIENSLCFGLNEAEKNRLRASCPTARRSLICATFS